MVLEVPFYDLWDYFVPLIGTANDSGEEHIAE